VTGISNLEVARQLLNSGLPTKSAVVFLDGADHKQVLRLVCVL